MVKIVSVFGDAHIRPFIVSQACPHDKIASRLLYFLSRDDTGFHSGLEHFQC